MMLYAMVMSIFLSLFSRVKIMKMQYSVSYLLLHYVPRFDVNEDIVDNWFYYPYVQLLCMSCLFTIRVYLVFVGS
jgi:hypothetical protein